MPLFGSLGGFRKIMGKVIGNDTPANNEVLTFDSASDTWLSKVGGGGGAVAGAIATYTITIESGTYTATKTSDGSTVSSGSVFSTVFQAVITDIGSDAASIELGRGTFEIGTTLTADSSNLTIRGQGMGVTKLQPLDGTLANNDRLFIFGSNPGKVSGTDVFAMNNGSQEDTTVTLTTVEQEDQFAVGDTILVRSGEVIDQETTTRLRGELHKVRAVTTDDTGVITLDGWLYEDYDVATVDIRKISTMNQNFTLRDLTFTETRSDATGSNPTAVKISWCYNVLIKNIQFLDTYVSGLQLHGVEGFDIEGCDFYNIRTVTGQGAIHYGMSLLGPCSNGRVNNCTFYEVRHSVAMLAGGDRSLAGTPDDSGEVRNVIQSNCTITNPSNSGLDSHMGCKHILYSNNSVEGTSAKGAASSAGILIRSPSVVIGNNFRNLKGNAIDMGINSINSVADSTLILGNYVENVVDGVATTGSLGSNFMVKQNVFKNLSGHGMDIDAAIDESFSNSVIDGNWFDNCTAAIIDIDDSTNITISNNLFSNSTTGINIDAASATTDNVRLMNNTFLAVTTHLSGTLGTNYSQVEVVQAGDEYHILGPNIYARRIGASTLSLHRAGGDFASPTAVGSGVQTGIFRAGGYDGTAYANGGRIDGSSTQTWTGSAHGMEWLFYTTPNSSTTNTLGMKIRNDQSVVIGTGVTTTNRTGSFLYVPSTAGAPNGTPVSQTGYIPLCVDSTNHKLYFYSGGAWRDAGP